MKKLKLPERIRLAILKDNINNKVIDFINTPYNEEVRVNGQILHILL